MARCLVYGLYASNDPQTIRYVGQTQRTKEQRLKQHLKVALRSDRISIKDRKQSRVEGWIVSVTRQGHEVLIRVLDSHATWDVSEVQWIMNLRDEGVPLMNVLDGGRDTPADLERRNKRARIAKAREGRIWSSSKKKSRYDFT